MRAAQAATLRPLLPADAAAFQRLRLQALHECPEAFTSSYEEEVSLSVAEIADRLASKPTGRCSARLKAIA